MVMFTIRSRIVFLVECSQARSRTLLDYICMFSPFPRILIMLVAFAVVLES
jgi:hypothetical protein